MFTLYVKALLVNILLFLFSLLFTLFIDCTIYIYNFFLEINFNYFNYISSYERKKRKSTI